MKIQFKRPQGGLSLSTVLALAFLAFSVVVLLISSGLQLFFILQTQHESISSQQQLLAQEAATSVSSFIQEKFSVLETEGRLANPATAAQEEQEHNLQSLLVLQPAFRQLILLNDQNQELARGSRVYQAMSIPLSNQLRDDALAQVKQGKRYISPVYIAPATNEPLVIMAVPTLDALGDFKGSLAAKVNLLFMWNLINQLEVGEGGWLT